MSLEETARQVSEAVFAINEKCMELEELTKLVLTKHKFDGDTFQFSQADKQKLIEHYQAKKAELEALVEALP